MTETELRSVFDTNVLISAALLSDRTPRRALLFALEEGDVLMSEAIFEELESRLYRKKFDRYLDDVKRSNFLNWLYGLVQFVDVKGVGVEVCVDPDDNKFLDVAISGGAAYLVTGNLKDFPVSYYEGVSIVSPAQFVRLRHS